MEITSIVGPDNIDGGTVEITAKDGKTYEFDVDASAGDGEGAPVAAQGPNSAEDPMQHEDVVRAGENSEEAMRRVARGVFDAWMEEN